MAVFYPLMSNKSTELAAYAYDKEVYQARFLPRNGPKGTEAAARYHVNVLNAKSG